MVRRPALIAALLVVVATQPPASASLGSATVELTTVVTLDQPVAMAVRPVVSADDDLYFAEKGGTVQRFDGSTTTEILDISANISGGGERGLLGLTISPDDDELFVNYTNTDGDTVVRGYPFDGTAIDDADGYDIIEIAQPAANHNGGNLAFGPDGYLYIGMGDGGNQDDPANHAQRRDSLLGKMLRIAPTAGGGYTVPASNPFAAPDDGTLGEIWARGLRNPWRFSFDRATGNLWIGDVGGTRREEIDKQRASSTGGENYGWRRMEGSLRNVGRRLPGRRHAEPFFEYGHRGSNCAITGGYVYRGSAIGDLEGIYVFADFCTGEVRAIDPADRSNRRRLGISAPAISSFGEDQVGELYVLSLGGTVSRIDPAGP